MMKSTTGSRLLIIHQGALGDVVLTFASIIGLRKRFDRIDILCQGQIGKLAVKLGLIDKAYPLESAYFATLFADQIDRKIKNLITSYQQILLYSFSADLESSINQIIDSPCLRITPRPPPRDRIHVAKFLHQNLMDGGLIENADLNDAVSSWQRKQAHRIGPPADSSKIIIHPGSGSRRKCWPLARFLELADMIEEKGWQPQFVCGPAEQDLAAKLKGQSRLVHNLDELTDLVDLLESAGGYIGNDSGVSHLAGFLGLPCVVIFGPADPARWKPPGPRVQIVRPELDCEPCFEVEPANCAQPECLTEVTLESVLTAFDRVYQ